MDSMLAPGLERTLGFTLGPVHSRQREPVMKLICSTYQSWWRISSLSKIDKKYSVPIRSVTRVPYRGLSSESSAHTVWHLKTKKCTFSRGKWSMKEHYRESYEKIPWKMFNPALHQSCAFKISAALCWYPRPYKGSEVYDIQKQNSHPCKENAQCRNMLIQQTSKRIKESALSNIHYEPLQTHLVSLDEDVAYHRQFVAKNLNQMHPIRDEIVHQRTPL